MSNSNNNNTKQVSKIVKRRRCQTDTNVHVIITGIWHPDDNSNSPTNFTCIFLEDVNIPFSSVTEKVLTPDSKEPLKVESGGETCYVSVFGCSTPNSPKIVKGGIYLLEGIFYNVWNERHSITTSIVTPVAQCNYQHLLLKIPFSNRKIDIDRDLPGEDRSQYHVELKYKKYRFIYVKVVHYYSNEQSSDSVIIGTFTPPPPNEAVVSTFIPAKGPNTNKVQFILNGGRRKLDMNEVIVDNEFILKQGKHSFMGQTKIYQDCLLKFQLDWSIFASILFPYIEGDAICLIDRARTKDLLLEDSHHVGIIALNTLFNPDLIATIKLCGFKLSWSGCLRLDPLLSNPSKMKHDVPNVDLTWSNGINLLQYSGDVSLLIKAEEKGWVEFYALTNRLFTHVKRQTLQKKTEEDILLELLDESEYATGARQNAVFALPTANCPCHIKHFVATNGVPHATKMFENQI